MVIVDVAEAPDATEAGLRAVAEMVKSGLVAGPYAAMKASVHGTLLPTEFVQVPPP
jgi:hypothetical protein